MLKQKSKLKTIFNIKTRLGAACAIVLLAVASVTGYVQANHLEDDIRELNQQNAVSQQAADQLAAQANDYQDAIDKLQAQINSFQQAIDANQAKQEQLRKEIEAAEAELARQKNVLGENIKTMYLEGQISTLEILASSKDLSDYVTKEQYRSSVQNKIKDSVNKINQLKQSLQAQKQQVEQLIKEQEVQRNQLASDRAKQAEMLAYTEGQKSAYEQQIKNNKSRIGELRRQQAIENARLFGSSPGTGANCGGDYPGSARGPWGVWGCNFPLDYNIDNWGMYNRQCVSYTAFKVAASGRYMPYWGGRGNAKQWDDNARAAGIPVDQNPRAGDVAVSNNGYYGHTMYVEDVSSDGSIYISDYNQQWDGKYRAYWISASTVAARGLVFIHF